MLLLLLESGGERYIGDRVHFHLHPLAKATETKGPWRDLEHHRNTAFIHGHRNIIASGLTCLTESRNLHALKRSPVQTSFDLDLPVVIEPQPYPWYLKRRHLNGPR